MKILVIVWNNFTNDKRVMNISNSLVNNEYDVSVIAAKEQKGLSRFEQTGYRMYRIPLFSSLYSLHTKFKINASKQQTGPNGSTKTLLKSTRKSDWAALARLSRNRIGNSDRRFGATVLHRSTSLGCLYSWTDKGDPK